MFESSITNAFMWGALSAVSLPIGALLGIIWKPKQKINSAFMAFGAGALLFALTIELFGHVPHHVEEHGMTALYVSLISALMGAFLFDGLNNVLNNYGAYLKRLSGAKRFLAQRKYLRAQELLKHLYKIDVLSDIPSDKMAKLMTYLETISFDKGDEIFSQGEDARSMYFVLSGEVAVSVNENGTKKHVKTLKQYDIFGEMGLFTGTRNANVTAMSQTTAYRIKRQDFMELTQDIPELRERLNNLSKTRFGELALNATDQKQMNAYLESLKYLRQSPLAITDEEVQHAAAEYSGHGASAALAIWLGILIDGVPESLIIGTMAISAEGISLAFIAGVFLANLPEAMSSAVSMLKNKMSVSRIMIMWGSLCLLTGLGAAFGATILPADPTGNMFYLILGVEGLAAGAMLTMIAETMLPEAFEQGGRIVGISTLLGFLAALIVKVL